MANILPNSSSSVDLRQLRSAEFLYGLKIITKDYMHENLEYDQLVRTEHVAVNDFYELYHPGLELVEIYCPDARAGDEFEIYSNGNTLVRTQVPYLSDKQENFSLLQKEEKNILSKYFFAPIHPYQALNLQAAVYAKIELKVTKSPFSWRQITCIYRYKYHQRMGASPTDTPFLTLWKGEYVKKILRVSGGDVQVLAYNSPFQGILPKEHKGTEID